MKKIFALYITLVTSVAVFGQETLGPINELASTSIGFVQNVGQVISTDNNPISNLYYHSIHATPKSYYFNNKASFVYAKFDKDTSNFDTLARLDMTWMADEIGNVTSPISFEPTEEKVNYYLAHCNEGCDQLTKYKGLLYENIYDNIDMMIYSNNVGYKIYFVVKPGGNPQNLRLNFSGFDNMNVSSNLIKFDLASNTFGLPSGVAYEYDPSGITMLPWTPQFSLNATGAIEIVGSNYNPSKALVYALGGVAKASEDMKNIDWSTYFGGEGNDVFYDVDVNSSGQPHATGWTNSEKFPVTTGVFQTNNAGNSDIMVVKFNPDLSLNWSTYYGGTEEDGYGYGKFGISIDKNDDIHIFPPTRSENIPLKEASLSSTTDYFDDENKIIVPSIGVNVDHLLTKFNKNGQLVWSTYFGGGDCLSCGFSNGDIIVDKVNNDIYVTGFDNEMPVKDIGSGAYYETISTNPKNGSFIAKFNSNLELQWCTFFGAESPTYTESLTLDKDRRLLVTGTVPSTAGFPIVTPTGYYTQSFGGGAYDQFLTRFNSNLSINWSTYIGGNSTDVGSTVITTKNDKIVVMGGTEQFGTSSNTFPTYKTTVSGVFNQDTYGDDPVTTKTGDATICTFDNNGIKENFTFLGGSNSELFSRALCSNNGGNIFLGGSTSSPDFPKPSTANLSTNLYVGASQTTLPPNEYYSDVFIFGLDKNFRTIWSTNFGSSEVSMYYANVCYGEFLYNVGYTEGGNFPLTSKSGAYSSVSKGGFEAIISRSSLDATPLLSKEIEMNKNKIVIFPNPAANKLNIISNSIIKEISVFDIAGKLVKQLKLENASKNIAMIDIEELNQGVFFVKVLDKDEKLVSSKFVKY